ncbi:pitrilysin family protein [Rubrivirga sp. S365]|uniref:M16 family metallopeptidase n=1 Tax=Rubrivirga sp. S365 TaxID=3076080 RepID=UPI0028CA7F62|nr:pitrilysin family protein [Rubrivirga sp. S365]MDT7857249.1 pitrilysin family protein [Rubrivirga sp. S365]
MPEITPGFQRTVLDNGVRVLTESVPSVHSVAVGAWVDAGSRDERPAQGGITHFIEHMVFKGTRRRRGYLINQRMESVGGYLNAFTTKEHTCFYARGLDEHLGRALETVVDLVTEPTLPPREIEKEKDVVVEEIKMYEDAPEDHVFDHYEAVLYPDHPLGRPVIGTPETVRSFSQADLEGYIGQHYVPNRLVVSVAGRARHRDVVRHVERLLDGFERAPRPAEREPADGYAPAEVTIERPVQQAHLVLGTRSLGAQDPRRTVLSVLNTILGGGMSSRLNQNIREKYGWCYSVYSFVNVQTDSGDVGVYIGTDASRVDRSRVLIERELNKLAESPVSDRMLTRAKHQLKGSIVLGLESLSNRMQRAGRVELVHGREVPVEEVVAEIEAVTAEEVRALAEDLFAPGRLSTVALLPSA